MSNPFRKAASLMLAFSAVAFVSFGPAALQGAAQDFDNYAHYSNEGSRLFNAGQLTQAIEMFEKALPLAPEPSVPIIYNNIAATYIKRGNYFSSSRQNEQALADFRKAYFYLEYAWPEGLEKKPLHTKNRDVAKENLDIAYGSLKLNPRDKAMHLEKARALRMQGKFQEAIVEYAQAAELDKKDLTSLKALGDLFNVINLPEKSQKYYALAANNAAGTGEMSDELLVQLGNAQYKSGQVDAAVVNFDKALAINPGNVAALNQLEKIWLNEIKFNPSSVLGHANLGGVYQKKKMYEQAMQQYNAAEHFAGIDQKTSFDTKKLIRLNIGTLFQEKKQYEMALKAYDTVLQAEPNHALANYYKATLLEETGNLDGAIQAYNRVLSIDPQNKGAQAHLLTLVKRQTDPAKLVQGLKDYANRFSSNAVIQAQVGEEFHNRKDLDNAAIFYQKALQLDPKLASAWANLGAIYQAQNKEELSLEAFSKAKALDPDNQTFAELAENAQSGISYKNYQQAVALQQEGKAQEALPYFRKALETSDTPEIRAAYGISLQSAGQLDNAIAEYQKALSKEPNNADYNYYIGTAYHQKNDLAKAQAAYKKALSIEPSYQEAKEASDSITKATADADLEKAVEAFNKKNLPLALQLVDSALAKNRENAMAHYYRGLILDAQKKPQVAIQSYREAIRYNPEFSDAYYALGVALDNAKDARGAQVAFQKFVELSNGSEDDFVQYARERLKSLSSN